VSLAHLIGRPGKDGERPVTAHDPGGHTPIVTLVSAAAS
jgi:hypothetical protein